jgi:hypothetical protein
MSKEEIKAVFGKIYQPHYDLSLAIKYIQRSILHNPLRANEGGAAIVG